MMLPKRVPWASVSELDEVCSWIYGPQADNSTKLRAKNRLCAWQVNTPLPHALESVLAFLNAMLLEPNNPSSATLRQIYALAIIRFVNGLVDPLQQGAFARPIYSLAAQIGLPAWIVELRHRSTHEDIPSLEVLREASHEAMEWLLNRYFLPTLTPSISTIDSIDLPPLDPLLSNYKALMKSGLKDASLQGRNKAELDKLMKDAAIWIIDVSALYAADSSFRGADTANPSQKGKLATQKFCERLCDKGGLVPVSKGKRAQRGKSLTVPPNQAIWAPLIQYLDQQNEHFTDEILACMLGLLNDNSLFESDPTFTTTIASWTLWAVDTLGDESGSYRRECVRSLLTGAGPEGGTPVVMELINALIAQDIDLASSVESLKVGVSQRQQLQWESESLLLLEERRLKLGEALKSRSAQNSGLGSVQTTTLDESDQLPPGWTQIPQSAWVPCPIGSPIAS